MKRGDAVGRTFDSQPNDQGIVHSTLIGRVDSGGNMCAGTVFARSLQRG